MIMTIDPNEITQILENTKEIMGMLSIIAGGILIMFGVILLFIIFRK